MFYVQLERNLAFVCNQNMHVWFDDYSHFCIILYLSLCNTLYCKETSRFLLELCKYAGSFLGRFDQDPKIFMLGLHGHDDVNT